MNTFTTVAIVLGAVCAALAAGPYYRTSPIIDITPVGENHNSNLGKVNGLRNCGGTGRVVEWRVDGCNGEGVCQLPGDDQPRQSELEFVPSEDIDALGVRFVLIREGDAQVVYERAVSDSAVQGGEAYIVNARAGATKELKGQSITTQYILYRVDTNEVETCAEADFQIV